MTNCSQFQREREKACCKENEQNDNKLQLHVLSLQFKIIVVDSTVKKERGVGGGGGGE